MSPGQMPAPGLIFLGSSYYLWFLKILLSFHQLSLTLKMCFKKYFIQNIRKGKTYPFIVVILPNPLSGKNDGQPPASA